MDHSEEKERNSNLFTINEYTVFIEKMDAKLFC
jgi:hypothetical protein